MQKKIPLSLQDHLLPFNWDVKKVWKLSAPLQEKSIQEFLYLLALPFWTKEAGCGMKFNVTPLEVLTDPNLSPWQYERVVSADTTFPLDFVSFEKRLCVLDGLHRLANLYRLGADKVLVRIHSEESVCKVVVS